MTGGGAVGATAAARAIGHERRRPLNVITDNWDVWIEGFVGTLMLFFGGGFVALILGIIVGAMRVSPVPDRAHDGRALRQHRSGTPRSRSVFFAFAFALPPLLGLRLTGAVSLTLAVAALGIYTATYVAETIRSGHQHRARRAGRGRAGASGSPSVR